MRVTTRYLANADVERRRDADNETPQGLTVRNGRDRRQNHDRRTEDQVRRRMMHGLEDFLWDGTPVPSAARVIAANRVFGEGTRYFVGDVVNRLA